MGHGATPLDPLKINIANKLYLPPPSNTGVQNTERKYMGNYSEEMKNQLSVSVDYIAFTVTAPLTLVEVIYFLGFDVDDFVDMPKGSNGYRKQKKNVLHNISILYDGNDNMGIHVTASGTAVRPLLNAFRNRHCVKSPFDNLSNTIPWEESVVALFFQEVFTIGKFARLDVAIDDIGASYYTPRELFDLYEDSRIVSKWKTVDMYLSRKAPRESKGDTVYFGSRCSSIMLRVYDKKREQNGRKKSTDDNYIDYEWTRWELEIKEKRADELAQQIMNGLALGKIAVGILYYYIRIIDYIESNKSRCPNSEKWDRFINGVDKMRLHCPEPEKTIYDKVEWIENQVAPSLCTMLILAENDIEVIRDIIKRNKHRIGKKDRELIKQLRPDLFELYFDEVNNAWNDNCWDI